MYAFAKAMSTYMQFSGEADTLYPARFASAAMIRTDQHACKSKVFTRPV
jgi:hypothetical protein